MFQSRHAPPEKQLLNLIEQAKAGKKVQPKIQPFGFRYRVLSIFSLSALKARCSFLQEAIAQFFSNTGRPLDIRGINNILLLCVIILALYFISNFIISTNSLQKMPELTLTVATPAPRSMEQHSLFLKKLPYYLETTRERDVFNPVEKIEGTGAILQQKLQSSPKIAWASANLRLVGIGISPSGEPDAMIEDVEDKRVYFLRRGEMIKDFRVEAIFKDSVVLRYEEEELILK
jgi:hypothetical protein